MRFNWKLLPLAIFLALPVLGTGCSGINASGGVSPATFLLPGLGQTEPQGRPSPVAPTAPPITMAAVPTP